MRTLPIYTFLMALFKLLFCTPDAYHHSWWCIPWQIVILPMLAYTIYFLMSLLEAIRIVSKLKHLGEHIEVEVG